MSYDFLVFSPDEFEIFSHDLLERKYGIEFERFKPGKDGGIDLRHYVNSDKSIIVQCKRYSEYSQLFRNLEKKEVDKVKKLNPSRYIVVTSVPLSVDNKTKIMKLFEPFILTPNDIIGKEELEDLLKDNPDIEKKQFKLWLTSINVLQKILHNGIHSRSEFTDIEIKNNAKLYVQNQSLSEAQTLLDSNKFVILSGNPGVGKTTLAKMLLLELMVNDYQVITISKDIEEAESVFEKGIKQVFYYDDFLGSNFLEDRLDKNEDKRLIAFINKISRDDNKEKKFIMTTREYILNQARIKYEIFNSNMIDLSKHIVDVKSYTELVKAKILYNHLFFSELNSEYINALISNKNYLKIIKHKNYNPRVIETMTFKLSSTIDPDNYVENFIENLNNPVNIWEHAFNSKISGSSQLILYILTIIQGHIDKEKLRKYHQNLSNELNEPFNYSIFNKSLKELENTFIEIRRSDNDSKFSITFQNPSIRDYLISNLIDRQDIIMPLVRSTFDLNILKNLSTNTDEDKIFINFVNQIDIAILAIEKYKVKKKNGNLFGLNIIDELRDISLLFDMSVHKNVKEFFLDEIMSFDNLYILPLKYQKSLINLYAER
ncbi:restriction endonuclease [Salipaludibacillus sp. HK11]|uniref:nSTAND3 domain-containing NTPase n=1 Tax=Salipaludibacillus sp. HK11 TaxID=3394320 RepID=UPI0039FBF79C